MKPLFDFVKEKKEYILLAAATILSAASVMLLEEIRVTNALSLLLIVGIWFFFKEKRSVERSENICIGISSAIIALFIILHGTQVLHSYELNSFEKLIALLTIMIGSWLLVRNVLSFLYCCLKNKGLNTQDNTDGIPQKKWILYWLIMLACQVPVYLCFFPGCVISDSTHQILQAINREYSNHHPVLQTWMIQGVLWIVSRFTDSLNAVVATYIALQEIIVTAIYTYIVYIMYKMKAKKIVLALTFIFFAIMPINLMMSDNMWKDTLFSAAVALFIAVLWKNIEEEKTTNLSLIILSGFIVCMFRNNGWYAYIASFPFLIVVLWQKKKAVCISLLLVILLSIVTRGPIFSAFNVGSPSVAESLSIPLQQISNVVVKGGELSAEEKALIENAVDINEISNVYDPRCSDPVKNLLNARSNGEIVSDNKAEYIKLWFKLGLKYPGFYLEAFVNQTEGYYNPDIQRYQYTQGVWDTQMPIRNTPLLPEVICKLIKLYVSDWMYKIPVLGILKSIGFFVWVLFALAGLCIFKKEYKRFILFLPMIFYWGTLIIATPVYAEFRYIYALFLCMPVYLMIALRVRKEEN
ncbi:hypothetical protein SAMN02910368_01814 [Lachnospiraceae bacterium G11]|nr:hypothetical protein SAMN02910368_01814 [Lachnospiraceae bacterium G11]